tara:strand:+ start:2379 stop:2558 length:180 start_codon:yes stop_codon:yes gene_type:complete
MSKWSKHYMIEILRDGQWRVITRHPLTYLQAVRLMLQDTMLRRYHDRAEARVVKTESIQ